LSSPPIKSPFDDNGKPAKVWLDWADNLSRQPKYHGAFATASRPTNGVKDGDWGIDTELGLPIYYLTSGWIDAAGNSV